jgi:hypothetical protein
MGSFRVSPFFLKYFYCDAAGVKCSPYVCGMENNTKNYKSLKDFTKYFSSVECYNKRFMKRKGGYVFDVIVNNEPVEIVVTPYTKEKEIVVFTGNLTNKTVQALTQVYHLNFKMTYKK